MKFKKNPTLISKKLKSKVGILNLESTELFTLDELATKVFFQISNSSEGINTENLNSRFPCEREEVKEIVNFLLEKNVITEI